MTSIREIENAVQNVMGGSRASAKEAVTAVFYAVTGALAAGETVRVQGFGTLKPIIRKARTGRNPATGAALEIPEKRDVNFKASADLKGRL